VLGRVGVVVLHSGRPLIQTCGTWQVTYRECLGTGERQEARLGKAPTGLCSFGDTGKGHGLSEIRQK
jgi:hypothetical protein